MVLIFWYTRVMKKLWFKNKTYGYGWVPVTWQGWIVIALWVSLNSGIYLWLRHNSTTELEAFMGFLPACILLTLLLITITHKTGEKPGWRWGDNLDDDKNNGDE